MARTTPKWELTRAALDRLMRRLDPSPATAGEKYERLRRALLKFFRWHGESEAEAAADETIDRLARRLEAGQAIDDVPTFAHGVARLVRLERRRRGPALSVPFDETLAKRLPAALSDEESLLEGCLLTCLGGLPAEERALIIQYYVDDGRRKIDQRARQARAMGVSGNALRHRAQRLREQLKDCATRCVDRQGSVSGPNEPRPIDTVSDSRKRNLR